MDFQSGWREVLSPVYQASFSTVFLPMRDEGSEDAVASDSNYQLRSRGEVDSSVSRLYKGGSSSLRIGSPPRECTSDIPVGENPAVAQTFGNQFFKVCGNYLATDFRTPGWIHPPKAWWRDLTLYVLTHFEEDLERLGLYEAVRANSWLS